MNALEKQLLRVDIAAENLEKSSVVSAKKYAKVLADETKKFLIMLKDTLIEQQQVIEVLKQEIKRGEQ